MYVLLPTRFEHKSKLKKSIEKQINKSGLLGKSGLGISEYSNSSDFIPNSNIIVLWLAVSRNRN